MLSAGRDAIALYALAACLIGGAVLIALARKIDSDYRRTVR